LFTLLGGLIVLAGFFVREGIQDQAKDDQSSISTATNLYRFKAEVVYASRAAALSKEPPSPGGTSQEQSRKTLILSADNLFDLQSECFAVTDLFRSLPLRGKSMEPKVAALNQAVQNEASTYLTLLQKLTSGDIPISALQSYVAKMQSITPLFNQFRNYVIKDAESERATTERLLHRSTVASYTLFSIGWFLGLIGKVLKLPALSACED
jgi:hypothetical protein